MKKLLFFLCLSGMLALVGCKKKWQNVNSDFYGTWYAERGGKCKDHIYIRDDGWGNWVKSTSIKEGGCTVNSSGYVKIRKDRLKIGRWDFDIHEYPVQQSNPDSGYAFLTGDSIPKNWKMTIECTGWCAHSRITYYRE